MSQLHTQSQQAELTHEVLEDIAYRRVHAVAWETLAAELGWTAKSLRFAVSNIAEFAQYLKSARAELVHEIDAESIHMVRKHMRSDDEKHSLQAAKIMTTVVANKERNATQLQIAELRAQVEHAKVKVQKPKSRDEDYFDEEIEVDDESADAEIDALDADAPTDWHERYGFSYVSTPMPRVSTPQGELSAQTHDTDELSAQAQECERQRVVTEEKEPAC